MWATKISGAHTPDFLIPQALQVLNLQPRLYNLRNPEPPAHTCAPSSTPSSSGPARPPHPEQGKKDPVQTRCVSLMYPNPWQDLGSKIPNMVPCMGTLKEALRGIRVLDPPLNPMNMLFRLVLLCTYERKPGSILQLANDRLVSV